MSLSKYILKKPINFNNLIDLQKFKNTGFAEPRNCKTGQPQLNINDDEELISIRPLAYYYWGQLELAFCDLGAWNEVYNSKKRHSKQWKIEHNLNTQWQYKKIDELRMKCEFLLGKEEVKKAFNELKKRLSEL